MYLYISVSSQRGNYVHNVFSLLAVVNQLFLAFPFFPHYRQEYHQRDNYRGVTLPRRGLLANPAALQKLIAV